MQNVTKLFYLYNLVLTVYNRTIARFIAYDKACILRATTECDGRCDWLQTTAEHDDV